MGTKRKNKADGRNAWKALEGAYRALSLLVLPENENKSIAAAAIELMWELPRMRFGDTHAENSRLLIIKLLTAKRKANPTVAEYHGTMYANVIQMRRRTRARLGKAVLDLYEYLRSHWAEEPSEWIGE